MLTRREFLEIAGLSISHLLLHPFVAISEESVEVFPQGIASGDPTQESILLWTRIEPSVHARLSKNLKVYVLLEGKELYKEYEVPANYISPMNDYTVRLKIRNLLPGRTYFYAFEYAGVKRMGRFKTLPDKDVDNYSIVFITCQNYEDGYYSAFRHIAEEEDIGFVLHLGDAIYECIYGAKIADRKLNLPSGQPCAIGLEDYRHLYRTYLSDPNYQIARATHSFIYIWDDHEFANDYYYDYDRQYWVPVSYPESIRNNRELCLRLRRASIKAWYEYTPAVVKLNADSKNPLEWINIYRNFKVGNLAHLICTDERSYRQKQCPIRYRSPGCSAQITNTMLGEEQRRWFFSRLSEGNFRWRIWANEVQFALSKIDGLYGSTDAWDGYIGERSRILEFLKNENIDNLIVLTGDRHAFMASDIPEDFRHSYERVLGAEFMTGALSSINASEAGWWKRDFPQYKTIEEITEAELTQNPWIRFLNQKTWGYSVLELSKEKVGVKFYSVDKYQKQAPKSLLASLSYERGRPLMLE